MTQDCVTGCGRPAPGAAACRQCASALAGRLTEAAGHAEDAWTVLARLARYGGGGGGRRVEAEPDATAPANRRNPVLAFGWQASVERPKAGALRPEPVPVDLGASERLATVTNVVITWARHVCEERGVELPARRPLLGPLCVLGAGDCGHPSCAGIRHRRPPSALGEAGAWLATQVEWLRHRPEAGEAFDELLDACAMLARLVDRPGVEQQLVGVCDCGTTLYALPWRSVVECPEQRCKLRWDVAKSRNILRDALREKLFTAAEAAHLAASWDERSSEQIRKLINKWSERGRIVAHGTVEGAPAFRFGDVLDRLVEAPRRERREREAVRT